MRPSTFAVQGIRAFAVVAMTLAAAPGAARDLATESPQAPAPAASPDESPPYLRDRGPGIATSMFTALLGSRALLTLIYGGSRKPAKLAIG